MYKLIGFALLPVCCFSLLAAQDKSSTSTDNPLSMSAKALYTMTKSNIMKSAEEMPESGYSFKPVDSVRTYGQILAHVADAQYEFCSPVLEDSKEHPSVEKSATTKAEIITGLKTAFGYCDGAFSKMTDAHAVEMVKFFNREMPKLAVLNFSSAHNDEHYGNLVTYLRIKGMVPPSSKK